MDAGKVHSSFCAQHEQPFIGLVSRVFLRVRAEDIRTRDAAQGIHRGVVGLVQKGQHGDDHSHEDPLECTQNYHTQESHDCPAELHMADMPDA